MTDLASKPPILTSDTASLPDFQAILDWVSSDQYLTDPALAQFAPALKAVKDVSDIKGLASVVVSVIMQAMKAVKSLTEGHGG